MIRLAQSNQTAVAMSFPTPTLLCFPRPVTGRTKLQVHSCVTCHLHLPVTGRGQHSKVGVEDDIATAVLVGLGQAAATAVIVGLGEDTAGAIYHTA